MITCVTLNPTNDICIPLGRFKRGNVLRSPFICSYPGGKASNTARALSAMGAHVSLAGFCAKNEIKNVSSFFSSAGVNPFFTPVSGSNRPCFLITEFKRQGETIINTEGSITPGSEDKTVLIRSLKKLAVVSSFTVFSGSLPACLPESYYRTLIRKLSSYTGIFIDTHSAPARLAASAGPDILKMNIDEFALTFGMKKKSRKFLKNKMKTVCSGFPVKNLIVTMHSKGAVFYSSGRFLFCRPPKIKPAFSPAGCGDAFTAGYLYGVSKGFSQEKCLKWAGAASAANLLHTGACFVERKKIKTLTGKIRITSF